MHIGKCTVNTGCAQLGLLICVLAFSSNAWSQTPGPHTSGGFGYNKYIDPAVLMPGICTPANAPTFAACEAKLEQETIAYYKAIGILQPNGSRNLQCLEVHAGFCAGPEFART